MSKQAFIEAQRKASVPGSVVLAKWNAERVASGAARDVNLKRMVNPQALQWSGISWDEFVNGYEGKTGVNEATARSVAAVTACVNLIGGSIASMPLHFYRRGSDGGREAFKDSVWWLLNERPYANWSAIAFWEYMTASRLFHGDAFARIHRASAYSPQIVGFEPWHPERVSVKQDKDGRLIYRLDYETTSAGQRVAGEPVILDQDDVLHISGPGFDGLRSVSQLKFALSNAAGIARSSDEQAAQFIADGVRPDFALEIPGNVNQEQADYIRARFVERHAGQGGKRSPVILGGGTKLHQLTMSSEDAQLLATRSFQIEEICRVFGVPPFMIGHTEKTTSWGSGIEQMSIGFVKYTLQRHLVAFEQEINHKIFKTGARFAEFVTAGLERGDIKTRYDAYRIALGRAGEPGWMKPSEIRALENMPADPSFDEVNNEPVPAPAGQQ